MPLYLMVKSHYSALTPTFRTPTILSVLPVTQCQTSWILLQDFSQHLFRRVYNVLWITFAKNCSVR